MLLRPGATASAANNAIRHAAAAVGRVVYLWAGQLGYWVPLVDTWHMLQPELRGRQRVSSIRRARCCRNSRLGSHLAPSISLLGVAPDLLMLQGQNRWAELAVLVLVPVLQLALCNLTAWLQRPGVCVLVLQCRLLSSRAACSRLLLLLAQSGVLLLAAAVLVAGAVCIREAASCIWCVRGRVRRPQQRRIVWVGRDARDDGSRSIFRANRNCCQDSVSLRH